MIAKSATTPNVELRNRPRRNHREGAIDIPTEKDSKARKSSPRDSGGPPHLLGAWPQAAGILRSASRLLIFVDFDGTLTPLRERPGVVPPLDSSTRGILRRLAQHRRVSVTVISGRPITDLRKLVRVAKVHLLGLHGWQGRSVPPLTRERALLREARKLLRQRLANTPDIRLEDKRLGVAVHYRGATPKSERMANPIVKEVVATLGPDIHILQGHKVWEILPRQIDGKGSAVRDIMAKQPQGTLPIFVGDDVSDERAFAAIPAGLTVCVGRKSETKAHYFLRDPEEVKAFLLKLEQEIV